MIVSISVIIDDKLKNNCKIMCGDIKQKCKKLKLINVLLLMTSLC